MVSVLAFIFVTTVGFGFAYKSFHKIYKGIQLGVVEPITTDPARWRNVILIAFGQKKMFKLWKPALLHAFIYIAFLFTQLELFEILIDGLFNKHRVLAPWLGGLYTVIISFLEILSVLALIATIAFLWRRNVMKVARFQKPEMTGWPRQDANLILVGEIFLIIGVFTMNGAEQALAQTAPYSYLSKPFAISSWMGPILFKGMDVPMLHILERSGWWLHYIVVLGFLNYLPYSKHLHIFLAFPTTYMAPLKPRGVMEEIPVITREVKSMLGIAQNESGAVSEATEFGANDVTMLSKRILLSAYSCTECGRCTAVCPANITGKKLSPRKIMMDIRDRCEEIITVPHSQEIVSPTVPSVKSLFDRISKEEIYACTTCQACVEACPVMINPMEPILEMRRYDVLNQSGGPASWTAMFNSLENSGCVWPMSNSRSGWATN